MKELTKSQKTNARRKARTPEQICRDQKRLRPDGVKTCPKCQVEYPLESFSADVYRADGLNVNCNDCWAVIRSRKKGSFPIESFWRKCDECHSIHHINHFNSERCLSCQERLDQESREREEKVKKERKAESDRRKAARERSKQFRVCKSCDVEKSIDKFDKLKRGRSWSCRECRPAPETKGSKECTSCHIEFPMNEFTYNKKSSDGRGSLCIECRMRRNTRLGVKRSERTDQQIKEDQLRLRPTGRKVCPRCQIEFVLEEFGRNVYTSDGTGIYCKKCIRVKNAKTSTVNSMRSEEEIRAARDLLRPEGVKACRYCRKTKTFDHFYINKSESDGLSQTCKECTTLPKSREAVIKELVSLYGETCLYPGCKSTELTIDHVIPLSKGGTSDVDNYQQLCRSHNSQKGASSTDYRLEVV